MNRYVGLVKRFLYFHASAFGAAAGYFFVGWFAPDGFWWDALQLGAGWGGFALAKKLWP